MGIVDLRGNCVHTWQVGQESPVGEQEIDCTNFVRGERIIGDEIC